VGEIEDEYDEEEAEVTCVNEREWEVDGAFAVSDAIELGWPIEESGEYETVAGWLMDVIDQLPELGETYELGGWSFTVTALDGRRIESLQVVAPEPAADAVDGTDA
jgi:putative hemolysin